MYAHASAGADRALYVYVPGCVTIMSDKKTPQLFHSDLFSSPSGGGSSGLSLGFDEPFSSPFSLAPATKSDGKEESRGVLYLE